MYNRCLLLINVLFISTMFLCCKKNSTPPDSTIPTTPIVFTTYSIKQGQYYADGYDSSHFVRIITDDLKFVAKFDSSAIYSTFFATNQLDVNKLYGFSDNNTDHHQFSARVGWAWYYNALHLFGYTYNNGERTIQQLGQYQIGQNINCRIQVDNGNKNYLFTINGKTTAMPRAATTAKGSGYRLYPYFGGDEPAPHPVKIQISE